MRAESSARALQCQQLPEQRQLSAGRRVYVEERVWEQTFRAAHKHPALDARYDDHKQEDERPE